MIPFHLLHKSHFPLLLLILSFFALLSSCGDDGNGVSDRAALDNAAIKQYLEDSSVVATEDASGIFYSIDEANPPGDTQPLRGSVLSIYYTATVLYGETYDVNTFENGDSPMLLKQGVNAVFPVGLDIGLAYMRKGEKFTFFIPSDLAYRDYSFSTVIPENAILMIEVELVNIQNELDISTQETTRIENYISDNKLDSANIDLLTNDTTLFHPIDSVFLLNPGFYYKRQSLGVTFDTLLVGDQSAFSYVGYTLDSAVFDRREDGAPFVFNYGVTQLIEALNVGLGVMERDERALFIVPSQYGYKESVFVIPTYLKQDFVDLDIIPQYSTRVAPYEVIIFETHLLAN